MDFLKLSSNGSIVLICILYIVYLNYLIANNRNLPRLLRRIFNNMVVKVLFLLLIIYSANMHKKLGGYTIAICLSIIYMLTYLAVSESFETMIGFNTGNMEQFTKYCNKKKLESFTQKNEVNENKEYKENKDTPVGKAYVNNGKVQGCDMTTQYASPDSTFNPEPHRPDESSMGTGGYDKIPPVGNGNDFKSDPPGPYSTSGTSYQFDMS